MNFKLLTGRESQKNAGPSFQDAQVGVLDKRRVQLTGVYNTKHIFVQICNKRGHSQLGEERSRSNKARGKVVRESSLMFFLNFPEPHKVLAENFGN